MSILLGITGSISAYKTPELIRRLDDAGICCQPILSASAEKFVSSLALSSVSKYSALSDADYFKPSIPHLGLLKEKSLLVVAPATANFIAKAAAGIAENLLLASFLSFTGPKLIVPAMHHEMWINPITQDNVETLKKHGVDFLGPDYGQLACNDKGWGRLVELDLIVKKIQSHSLESLDLRGKKILITSGGTSAPIDNVRTITNSSTGLLGETLSHLASFFGAEVTCISTKPILKNPAVKVLNVNTVNEMGASLNQNIEEHDALIMAAAVSDFEVSDQGVSKLKRAGNITLDLVATEDLLMNSLTLYRPEKVIGFCLEDENLEAVAQAKLSKKGVDLIVANNSQQIGQKRRDVMFVNKTCTRSFNDVDLLTLAHYILSEL